MLGVWLAQDPHGSTRNESKHRQLSILAGPHGGLVDPALWTRGPETNGILEACEDLGVGFVPYSPLGKGFLTGAMSKDTRLGRGHGHLPDLREVVLARHAAVLQGAPSWR